MKHYLNAHRTFRRLLNLALAASLALPLASLAASVTLATSPLATSTTSSVSPNLMFILDDSGSMGWNYMPDNANDFNGAYGFASNQCNGVYYDPSLTYSPPVDSTGVSYANASFTAAWNDGYNTGGGTTNLNTSFQPSSSYTTGKAFYYFYTGTQTDPIHKDYYNTAGVFYNECNSSIGTTTIFDGVNPVNTLFTKRTLATTENTYITVSSGSTATITVNTASSTFRLGQITVGGAGGGDIMSGRSSSASTTSEVASNIAAKINSCTLATTGNCNVSGYSATVSGSVITISGPATAGAAMTYNVNAGSWTYTATAFSAAPATAVSSIKVGTTELLLGGTTASSTSATTLATTVAAAINATGYSATASGTTVTVTGPASAANYTPVITSVPASGGMTFTAGTFPETDAAKLTNFANWYSYYRIRMLMMKTSTGLAFKPIDNKYRVGFMTINNNNSPDVVDLKAFDATQKSAWYAKLYAASPNNSTPLREALAKAGLFYAHKLSSNSLNSLTVRDPIQYSCQQNFTILSTDGFWNGNDGFKMDGSTAVGNQDGAAPRPLFDGARANKTTTQVWQTKKQVTRSTSQIQKRTEQIQSQTSSLQSITSTLQQLTTQQQQRTKTLQFQTGALQKSTNGGSTWSNVASCTWVSPTIVSRTITVTATSSGRVDSIKVGSTQLMSGKSSTPSPTGSTSSAASNIASKITQNSYSATASGSVITITGPATSGALTINVSNGSMTYTTATQFSTGTSCRYDTMSGWANAAGDCTNNDQSSDTSNGTTWSGNKVSCQYTAWSAPSSVASCTPVAVSGSSPYSVLTAVDCPTASTTATVTSCAVTPVDGSGVSTSCSYIDGPAVNVSSCTNVAKSTGSPYAGPATTCSYTAYTAWANASSCTPAAQDTTAPYDMLASGGTATNCQTTDTGWVNIGSCTPGVTGGQTVTCQTLTTGPTAVASCTAVAASSGNSWTATSCTTTTVSPKTLVATCACTAGPQCIVTGGAPDYFATTCDIVTTTVNDVASCAPETASAANGYKTVTCSAGTGGTSDTLADVAMYYYQTDLRDLALWNNCTGGGTGTAGTGAAGDVCANNVYISGADNNVKQHMTTFTLGLGARGRMVFSPSYQTDLSGDFVSVKNGAIADSTTTPPTCSWQANGSVCNWPVPAPSAIENIDDLWHAAVDGRGTYFSATDPASLASGLSSALSSITSRKGSAAAAATSTLNPVAGNNFAYVASYTTVKWTGNLESRSINVTNGVISEAATWCVENTTAGSCSAPSSVVVDSSGASAAYNCVTPGSTAATCTSPAVFDSVSSQCSLQMPVACAGTMPALVGAATDTRIIKTANSAGTALVDFVYANLNSADFDATRIGSLSQWAALTATQKTAAAGANLVNFLRGQYGFEERASNLVGTVDNRIYRYREAVMGDALESQPAYLGPPVFSYSDPGYTAFKTAKSARSGTVYMGANDGMLHAFAADTGVERWAYVPSVVIPNMWILADRNYDIKHTNFVNGSPTMSDVCVANCTDSATADWRTILVGGLNAGGRGFYALDITNPAAPALLWEFTPAKASPYGDANVGYSFGQPIITKMTRGTTATSDDTWVVLVTSGYNNTSPGDGKGYLYVLNALTGAKITAIPTNVGDTTTPSGLAKISGWNSEPASNVASYVYGGDLLGNVWRFDINSAAAPLLFATLKDPSGNPQPVTTSPVLGQIIGKRVIFVGTGKYLETSDLTNTQVQSIYAIKDDDATTTFANPRAHTTAPKMVNQTITASGSSRTVAPVNPVDFSTDRGWYIDFPDGGERVNIDSQLVLGTLLVPTIVPSSTVCSPGGYGWLNFFDYQTGGPVPTSGTTPPSTVVSVKYDSTIVGLNIIFIEGTPIVEVVTSFDPTPRVDENVNIPPATADFTGKRMLWRELIP
ncbi:MAG: PilC/PilY family type IV pilus protein [Gallionella sp.]|nr:PilC/PilY family type IV pilus protein [Gallionella sp.]